MNAKKVLAIMVLGLLCLGIEFVEAKPLNCKKNCGTVDVNNEFSFQARIMTGSGRSGCNVTFIEDDIILTASHCLGVKSKCCDSETLKKKSRDWKKNKDSMYVVDGKNYPEKKIIIAKILDISARATKGPFGFDTLIAHVDRNCNKCQEGKEITIKPIPIANSIPALNTKALHVVAPETTKKGKGRIYRDHLLDSKNVPGYLNGSFLILKKIYFFITIHLNSKTLLPAI